MNTFVIQREPELLVSAEGSLQDGFPYMNMYCKLHNKVVVPSRRHIVYKEKVVHTYI